MRTAGEPRHTRARGGCVVGAGVGGVDGVIDGAGSGAGAGASGAPPRASGHRLARPARSSRVGPRWQVAPSAVPPVQDSLRPAPAPAPLCECGEPCVWQRRRWFCADDQGGCAYESEVPPHPPPLTPTCECGRPCKWLLERWWCPSHPHGGCGFELEATERAEWLERKVLAWAALGYPRRTRLYDKWLIAQTALASWIMPWGKRSAPSSMSIISCSLARLG